MTCIRGLAVPAALSVAVIATSTIALSSSPAVANESVTYNYDAKGRLVLVTHAGDVNNGVVANYTFDDADNRKNLKVTGSTNPAP